MGSMTRIHALRKTFTLDELSEAISGTPRRPGPALETANDFASGHRAALARRRLELGEVQVEVPRLLALGMDEQRSHSDLLARARHSV